MPPEPFGIAVDSAGKAVVVAHQVSGQLSLFVNDWQHGVQGGPNLKSVLGGLPAGAMELAAIPTPEIAEPADPAAPCPTPLVPYQPGFLLTFRNSPQVQLVRFFDQCAANGGTSPDAGIAALPFLEASTAASIRTNSGGFDSRGIAIDEEARRACEQACPTAAAPGGTECLLQCAAVPLDVYVGNRQPPSLVIGHTLSNLPETAQDKPPSSVPTSDAPSFYDSIPVTAGASRIVIGKILDAEGREETRVFIVCFDSRQIFIYNPATRRLETTIHTGRGPQAFAVDTVAGANPTSALPKDPESSHALGYIGHFTDSYIGVVDLDQRHLQTYGKIILSVGTPVPPRASK
jgi:hypothetical protein